MKNKFLSSILMATLLLTASCAGLISGKTQSIFLRAADGSEDVDVEVMTSQGMQRVTVPTSIMVPRNKMPLTITVMKDKCFRKSVSYVSAGYNPMLATNALAGLLGLTGTSIDMSSGAAWSYDDTVFISVRTKRSCDNLN